MNSVKKVISKKIHKYNLRGRRKKVYVYKRPGVPKVNTSVQCDLSEEENCELSKELPFALSYGDLFSSSPEVYRSELQPENSQRRSTAFSSPEQANTTQREPLDISIEQGGGRRFRWRSDLKTSSRLLLAVPAVSFYPVHPIRPFKKKIVAILTTAGVKNR